MTTLSTHDTKRSEDVRARLAVLAEIPTEWAALVRELLSRHPLADRPLAHLVWQNLVGDWPLSRERAHGYVEKTAREAGTSTTCTNPVQEFEEQLHALVDAAYDDEGTAARIDEFVERVASFGRSNSLSQKLLQLTMSGVPDVYQGTELWDLSLVDVLDEVFVAEATASRVDARAGQAARTSVEPDRGAAPPTVQRVSPRCRPRA